MSLKTYGTRMLGWLLLVAPCLALSGCAFTADQSNTMQIRMAIYTPLCIEVAAASIVQGAILQTYPCVAGERRQEWTFVAVQGSSSYQVINSNSLQCMTVIDGSSPTSLPVVQVPCYSPVPTSQLWTYTPDLNPGIRMGYNLISASSGLCLDIPDGATVGETQMQVFTCNPQTDPAQGFTLQAVAHGTVP